MTLTNLKLRRTTLPLITGALIALGLILPSPVLGDFSRDLITQPIDETKLITIGRSVRLEANATNDRGPVPDDFPLPHMLLQLKRSPAMESEFVQYIDQLTDKKSPNFRKWLTAKEIGEKYGPSEQDLNTITHWLESHGFSIYGVHPNRLVIDISGTAATLREAFRTQVDYLYVDRKSHFANMTNLKIPEALAPVVVGLVQIHDFAPQTYLKPKAPNYFISPTLMPLVAADFETIYNVRPLFQQGIRGEGQTITLVEDSDSFSNDIATYPIAQTDRSLHPLTGTSSYVVHIPAGQLPPVTGFWSLTMYDSNGFFVPNPLHRYVINDRSKLHHNPDGSIDIYIQQTKPTNPQQAQNWLPTPAGAFHLIWRLYGLKPNALPGVIQGTGWTPAAIQPCTAGRGAQLMTTCAS